MSNYQPKPWSGAVWEKTAASGLQYYSGHIVDDQGNKHYFAMFENDQQGNSARPKFNIVGNDQEQRQTTSTPAKQPVPAPTKGIEYPDEDINPDDIPF